MADTVKKSENISLPHIYARYTNEIKEWYEKWSEFDIVYYARTGERRFHDEFDSIPDIDIKINGHLFYLNEYHNNCGTVILSSLAFLEDFKVLECICEFCKIIKYSQIILTITNDMAYDELEKTVLNDAGFQHVPEMDYKNTRSGAKIYNYFKTLN